MYCVLLNTIWYPSFPEDARYLPPLWAAERIAERSADTEPKSALPGTIRGDYAHVTYGQASSIGRGVANILHASADADEAKKEIAHWFAETELHDYNAVHEQFTQPQKKK